MSRPAVVLCVTRLQSIQRLLRLDEALFRTDNRNVIVVCDGVKERTIVAGVGSNLHSTVALEAALRENIPLIRRFSGGGVVLLDESIPHAQSS
jgi:lipoate-protein ligase A